MSSEFSIEGWHIDDERVDTQHVLPGFRTIAIHMHFRIQPARVVEGTGFDEPEIRHNSNVRDNWRSAFRTEVSINWLTAVASIAECFKVALN